MEINRLIKLSRNSIVAPNFPPATAIHFVHAEQKDYYDANLFVARLVNPEIFAATECLIDSSRRKPVK